jgi:hypothetical protein
MPRKSSARRKHTFYLEEGDSIRAEANAADDLELIIGYEDIS